MLYPIELRVRKDRQANAKVREVKETASRETMVRDWYLWARLLHHYFISASCFSVSSMAQTRRMGKRNRRADLPKAPRPPTQASARPSLKSMLTERRGRDVGFAESGFRPTVVGKIMPTDLFVTCPFPVSLRLLTRMG
jgi:hypothetical protein